MILSLLCCLCSHVFYFSILQRKGHRQQSMDKINMVHPRKVSPAESWSSSRFFIINISKKIYFDHLWDHGFVTIIDGAKGGSVMAKILSWVKLDWVNSIWNILEVSRVLNWQIFFVPMKSEFRWMPRDDFNFNFFLAAMAHFFFALRVLFLEITFYIPRSILLHRVSQPV